jgi:hypothetical protein
MGDIKAGLASRKHMEVIKGGARQSPTSVTDVCKPNLILQLLSDDDLELIFGACSLRTIHMGKSISVMAALVCSRFRACCVERGFKIRTSLHHVSSTLQLLRWATDHAHCPYPLSKGTDTLVQFAASHGAVDVMQFARSAGCPWDRKTLCKPKTPWLQSINSETMTSAAAAGHTAFMEVAHELGCPWGHSPLYSACRNGHLAFCKRAHELGCPIDEWASQGAAENGHAEILHWLSEVGAPMARACAGAAEASMEDDKLKAFILLARDLGGEMNANVVNYFVGNEEYELMRWALTEGCSFGTCATRAELESVRSTWFHAAAIAQDWDLVELLHERGMPWHSWAASAVIANFPDEMTKLKWMHQSGCPLDGRTMYEAVRCGLLEVAKWLHELNVYWEAFAIEDDNQDYPDDEDRFWAFETCGHAAVASGSIEMVEWVMNHSDLKIEAVALTIAAVNGDEDMIRYLLREHPRCEWLSPMSWDAESSQINTLSAVFTQAGVDMFRTCVSLGAPLTAHAFATVATSADVPCRLVHSFNLMKWLLEHKCPLDASICSKLAAEGSKSLGRKKLLKLGLSPEMQEELRLGSEDDAKLQFPLCTLRWLRERGVPWDEGTMRSAASCGHIDTLKWAHQNGCPIDVTVVEAAARCGHFNCLKWLLGSDVASNLSLSPSLTTKACEGLHDEAVTWLVTEKDAPFDFYKCVKKVNAVLDDAIQNNRENAYVRASKMYEWLFKHGLALKLRRISVVIDLEPPGITRARRLLGLTEADAKSYAAVERASVAALELCEFGGASDAMQASLALKAKAALKDAKKRLLEDLVVQHPRLQTAA